MVNLKKQKIRLVFFSWMLVVSLFMLSAGKTYAHDHPTRHVLILNSYHSQYRWSSGQSAGAQEAILQSVDDVEIYSEYMDTKRNNTPEHLASLVDFYKRKYADIALDAVVTTDDSALNFVMDHHDDIFHGAPVAFSGVNNYDEELFKGKDYCTGTVGTFDVGPTVEMALKLHKDVKKFYIITDKTPTGLAMRKAITDSVGRFVKVEFEFLNGEGYSMEELLEKLQGVEKDSVVLMAIWFRDRLDTYYTYEQATQLISDASPVPVYGIIRMQLGYGIVGGQLLDGKTHGRLAGEMAVRFLNGESPKDIPIKIDNFNPYMFDVMVLERWGVDKSLLPAGAEYINKRVSMFKEYEHVVVITACVIVILILLVVMLAANNVYRRRVAVRVVESEKRFRQLTDNTAEIFWLASFDFNKVYYVSPAYEKVWGRSAKELEDNALAWADSLQEEDRQAMLQTIVNLNPRDSQPVKFPDYRVIRPDGEIRWISATGYPVMGSDGKAYRLAGVAEDITERKEAEQELRESDEKFQQLARNIPEIFWIGSPDWQEIYYISPSYEKVWGRSCQELYDRPLSWIESLHPDDRENVAVVFAGRDGNDVSEAIFPEYRIIRPDGEIRWISARGFPVVDEHGKVYRIAGIAEDITERRRQQEQLAQVKAMLQTAIESVPVGMVIARTDTEEFDLVNTTAKQLLGVEASEGIKVSDIPEKWTSLHPDGREFTLEELPLLRAMSQGEVTKNVEMILRRNSDGKEFWCILHAAPVFNDKGKIIAGVVVFPEVTELKKAEQALRESEEKHRALVENSPDVIMRFDREGRHLFVSQSVTEMTGMRPEELLGKTHREMGFDEEQCEFWEGSVRKVYETGEPVETEFEFEGINKAYAIDWRLYPEFGEDGKVNTVLSIARDITEQREATQRYETLFEKMLDGYAVHEMIFDDDGKPVDYRFLAVNPAFEAMTGLIASEITGKRVSEVLPEIEPFWIETYGKVVLTGEPVRFENYSQSIDKYFEVLAFRNQPGQFTVAFEDVTQRKKVEMERERLLAETEAKNAELERFTYTVSHDLKSPLITIKGYLGMVERDAKAYENAQMIEDLKRIGYAADRMHELLDELLELSRIGRLDNPVVELDLREVVEEALQLVSGRIKEKGIDVEVADDWPVIYGDRPRTVEVFQNLIDNAAKYIGEQAEPRIEIGVHKNDETQVFYVRDNGMGIESIYLDKVFGLFDQLNNNNEGTGIGLALVKRIVETHNGKIWAESDGPGKGSTFCFTWNRKMPESESD